MRSVDDATLTFPVEAGALVRGQVRRAIKNAAWAMGCEVSVEEDRGFWGSAMRFTITGPSTQVACLGRAITKWMADVPS